jgi:phage-related protein
MSFWGNTFIFDDIPSETYGLYISSPEGGMVDTTGSGDVELMTQTVFRRPKPYLLGVQQAPVLSFDVQFTSPWELMAEDIKIIQAWLFGKTDYKKLQIVQYDMQNIYFNCFLTAPRIIRAGNKIQGIAGTVVCDSPFAWAYAKSLTKTYAYTANETFLFLNESDNSYYEYPAISATVSVYGGGFSVKNITDSNRTFTFTGLSANEVLSVDNEHCIISSSTGLLRLTNFNQNWFRLVYGVNQLQITGNVASITFTYTPAVKMA